MVTMGYFIKDQTVAIAVISRTNYFIEQYF